MSVLTDGNEFTNWVDPDILTELGRNINYNREEDQEFKEFFESGWLEAKYDDLRERWDPLINGEEHQRRLLGKVALWNLVRLRAIQSGTPFRIDRSS